MLHSKFYILNSKSGFTLLEMVVSMGIFTVVIIVSISILVALDSAQSKSSRLQVVQDTARYTLEEMVGRLRGGTDYVASNCAAGVCHNINFTLANGVDSFWYCWDQSTGAIYTQHSAVGNPSINCSTWGPSDRITSPDAIIANLNFLVTSVIPGSQQGMVTITTQVQARDPKLSSPDTQMNLQATVTRRKRQ